MSKKEKLLLSILVVGVAGIVAAFGVFSAFSSQTSNPGNNFTAGTVNISAKREYAVRAELKMIRVPSGVQPRTRSAAGCHVSLFGTLPEALTTNTSTLPS